MKIKLQEGWKEVELGDICEIVSGTTPSTIKPEFWNGDIFWITPADIENGHNWYCYKTKKKITNQGLQSSSLRLLPKGTVMLTSRAPIGKVAIAGVEMCSNQGFKNFICNNEIILPEYLYFWLRSKEEYLNSLGRGATFKEITKLIVSKIKIPLPSISTQKQIVSFLEKAEKLKELRNEADGLTKEYLKAVFLETFSNGIANDSDHVFLEDVTTRITDGEHITPNRVNKGIYLLSARNILNHRISLEDVDFIDEKEFKKISKRIQPQLGDVLVSCSGSVGRVCRVKDDYRFQLVRSVALIRPNVKLNPIYLEYFFDTDYMQMQISKSINQSSQANLFQGKIKKLRIFLPPLEIQNKFATIVKENERITEYQKQSKEYTENLFNTSMQKAFKGELLC